MSLPQGFGDVVVTRHLGAGGRFVVNGNVLTFTIVFVMMIFICVDVELRHGGRTSHRFVRACAVGLAGKFMNSSLSLFIGSDLVVSGRVSRRPIAMRVNHFTRRDTLVVMSGVARRMSIFSLDRGKNGCQFRGSASKVGRLTHWA